MLDQSTYKNYVTILNNELIAALGCTEPIAIAYAAAKAREVLGCLPEQVTVQCSGNIIKNVKAVTVPNSGGLKGIESAAVLGAVGGDPSRVLSVLESVKPQHIEQAQNLLKQKICICTLVQDVPNLYIRVIVTANGQSSEVEIRERHTFISEICKNGDIIFSGGADISYNKYHAADYSLLNVWDILEFADTVSLEDIKEVINRQIEYNSAISEAGLTHSYGVEIGKTLLKFYPEDIRTHARAAAAAGSDARMSGCPLPVIINSGSGNQGITVTMPVVTFAKGMNLPMERLYRALVVSNLVAIHQKRYLGDLSAYCGAVCAATGSGAAITYMLGGSYEQVSDTITNTVANIGGMICDGAKPSCAAKISSAVDAAVMAHYMSMNQKVFANNEGLVKADVEKTIQSIGRMGRVGMKSTDVEILNIMLEH